MSRWLSDKYIDKIVANVKGSLAIEGCIPSESAVTINRQFLEGKITSSEAVRRIKEKYKKYIGGK